MATDSEIYKNWVDVVNGIFSNLLYPDAGGMTINHPKWSGLSVEDCKLLLDFDKRVLGLEYFNQTCNELTPDSGNAWDMWDEILITGRRCWGFSSPDHYVSYNDSPNFPKIILLINGEINTYSCLKAYRSGAFYGTLVDSGLAFNEISLNGNTISVQTNESANISMVCDKVRTTITGTSATFTVPANATYARIEAVNGDDAIYSNPIILKPYRNVKNDIALLFG